MVNTVAANEQSASQSDGNESQSCDSELSKAATERALHSNFEDMGFKLELCPLIVTLGLHFLIYEMIL